MNMPITRINDSDNSTLANICAVAADRFAENASEFDRLATIVETGRPYPTGPAAKSIADQFRRQEEDARRFANLFAGADPFEVETDDEDEAKAA